MNTIIYPNTNVSELIVHSMIHQYATSFARKKSGYTYFVYQYGKPSFKSTKMESVSRSTTGSLEEIRGPFVLAFLASVKHHKNAK